MEVLCDYRNTFAKNYEDSIGGIIMAYLDKLFDLRSNIGNKLELIMEDRKITKAQLCSEAGISRPTLDKMIGGEITNKTNYDKHLEKILKYLKLTPDELIGNIKKNRVKNIREILKMHIEDISNFTGISVKQLKRIEAGEDASLAELRDLAMCLRTSVNVIKQENYFEPQVSTYFLEVNENCNKENVSGFWGNIGILAINSKKYKWYPITDSTRDMIYESMGNNKLVIPCMNNTVLYLNMDNIQKIVLLDEACGGPYDMDWDSGSGEGEIPLVVYESLNDYEYESDKTMSEKFKKAINTIAKKYDWKDDDYIYMTQKINIDYKDGRSEQGLMDFNQDENLSDEVAIVYDGMSDDFSENIVYYTDINEIEIIVNISNIAMIELPFIELENAIVRKQIC